MTDLPLRDREIFAMGKWNASTGPIEVTSTMLDDAVNAYNELNSKISGYAIPIKLGHNKMVGAPAYGYAENVRRQGNTLIADFNDVPPEIVDAIEKKRYNAVSVELWPKVQYADKVFPNVLSGVALLGAEWPAVKGLKPLSAFGDASGALVLSQEEEEMPNFTQEQHDAILASSVAKAKEDAKVELAAELTAANSKIETLTQERDTAKAALAAFTDEKEKSELTAIITAAEAEGKIVPANRAKIEAFAESLRSKLSGDDRKSSIAMFKDFVEGLPKKVDYSEKGRGSVEKPGEGGTAQDEVTAKVKAAQKVDKKLSFKDALAQVFEEDPDLKSRYAEENR